MNLDFSDCATQVVLFAGFDLKIPEYGGKGGGQISISVRGALLLP
jgi:hypothetical protein